MLPLCTLYLIIHDRCEVVDRAQANVSQLPKQDPRLLDELYQLHRAKHEVPNYQYDHHFGPSYTEKGVIESDHLHGAAVNGGG